MKTVCSFLTLLFLLSACGSNDSNNSGSEPTPSQEPVNTAPLAVDDVIKVLNTDGLVAEVLGNDSDPENGELTITKIFSPPKFGCAHISQDAKSIQYQLLDNLFIQDLVVYEISDGELTSSATLDTEIAQKVTLKGSIHRDLWSSKTLRVKMIGRQGLELTLNETGDFTYDIELSSESLVVLEFASAKENADVLPFFSVLGNASDLVLLSGEERVLTTDQLYELNVSSLTTASYLEVMRKSLEAPLRDYDEYQQGISKNSFSKKFTLINTRL